MSSIHQRLAQTAAIITGRKSSDQLPWDPDSSNFPRRKDLPKLDGAPEGAAWVWGKDDNVC